VKTDFNGTHTGMLIAELKKIERTAFEMGGGHKLGQLENFHKIGPSSLEDLLISISSIILERTVCLHVLHVCKFMQSRFLRYFPINILLWFKDIVSVRKE